MHIMKRTQTLVLALAVGAAVFAAATPETDRNNAYRLRCELQTADGNSLDLLKWQQGTTPRISLDQYRNGKAVNADSNTVAVFRFGPSATNTYYVSVTNYAVTGNGYLVQIPTVGTNTVAGADWWYTAYLVENGYMFWTGNGRVRINKTTSTENALDWQNITCYGGAADAAARLAGDVAGSNYVRAVALAITNAVGTVRAVQVGDVWTLTVITE